MLRYIFMLGLGLVLLRGYNCEEEKKPNILFIMTDEHRYDLLGRVQEELSQYNGKLKVRTPNLDRLSRDGAYFQTAYTQCPVCGPARTCLRTGLTVETSGVQTNPLTDEENRRNPKLFQDKIDQLEGLDQILVEGHGYVSEFYGKWHIPDRLYHSSNGSSLVVENNDYSYEKKAPRFRKSQWATKLRQFLSHFEKEGYIEKTFQPGQQEDTYSRWPYTPISLDSRYGLATNTPIKSLPSTFDWSQNSVMGNYSLPKNYSSSFFNHDVAMKALNRLAMQQQQDGKPFLITVSQHLPHPPMMAPHELLDYYWNRRNELFLSPTVGVPLDRSTSYFATKEQKNLEEAGYCDKGNVRKWTALYYAMVEEIDDLVGIMLKRLDDLGIADNTVVVFTSDHGEMLGSHCRRGKSKFFEESARVPLIIKYPGAIPAGTVVSNPVNHIDLFSTLLDYSGASSSDKSQGVSLRRFIDGTPINEVYDETVAIVEWDYREPLNGTRLSRNLDSQPNFMVRHGDFKLMIHKKANSNKRDVLYYLAIDPFETSNRIDPDNGPPPDDIIGKAEHLKCLLLEWMERMEGGRNDHYSNPVYNANEGQGDMLEIHLRQSWPRVPFWVGSSVLKFGPPQRYGDTRYIRHEWLYIGRRTPGTVEITKMSIEGDDASLFSLSEQSATITSLSYIRVRVTFESDAKPSDIGRIQAVINIENDAGPSIPVAIMLVSEAPNGASNSPVDVSETPSGTPDIPVAVSEPASGTSNTLVDTVLNNGQCIPEQPCGRCVGDCDSDDDCQNGLLCFRRNRHNPYGPVPGCTGAGGRVTDYCYGPPS